MGDSPEIQSGSARKVGNISHMGAAHDACVVNRHIAEQSVEIDVLLGVRINQVVESVSGDGQNRLAVEFRVIQAIEQMNSARPGGSQAHSQFACVFGIRTGHECGRLFVTHVNETDSILAFS